MASADFHLPDSGQTLGNVGVLAVELNGGVESARLHQRHPPADEVPPLHHRPAAKDPSVHRVGDKGDDVEQSRAQPHPGRRIVVPLRSAQADQPGIPGELAADGPEPTGRELGIRVDVRHELAAAARESRLAGKRDALPRLVHEDHAGIPGGDRRRLVAAGVVDDDHLVLAPGVSQLRTDRVEAAADVGGLVICRDHEADLHAAPPFEVSPGDRPPLMAGTPSTGPPPGAPSIGSSVRCG
jgi:hypothetical protein